MYCDLKDKVFNSLNKLHQFLVEEHRSTLIKKTRSLWISFCRKKHFIYMNITYKYGAIILSGKYRLSLLCPPAYSVTVVNVSRVSAAGGLLFLPTYLLTYLLHGAESFMRS